ncbi:hypothetical protein HCN44_003194 [Aphidius gifuensis]|uniref:RNA polymerase II-associated protein 1 n=1 Tax=Aphidius gifuensis TaxID=684658 RepID=A0A834XIH2_APHGI|nr:hypothetical protein HCN44_003194 [Aphidius gifuensis]
MDNLKPIKRPKPSDGEEDLYKMQDEFLKSHQQPSAKVINLRAENKQSHYSKAVEDDKKPPVKFKSKFAERRSLLKAQEKLSTSQIGGSPINSSVVTDDLSNIIKPCESLQDNIQDIPKEPSSTILGNIIERKITKINYKKTQEIDDNNGFPSVFVIDHNEKLLDNDKSFFSKSLASSVSSPQKNKIAESVVKQETVVVNSLLSDISQENQQRLDNMTADEIIEEKKKLENMLSPKMINFLKARSNKSKKIPQKAEEMEVEETSKDSIENTNNSIVQPPNEVVEIVEKANEKGWIHMDEVEQVKLEWMTDLPETKTNDSPPEEPYNARFDFDGMLLPFKDDNVAVNSGLHHHGDEPDRPGYSLQELLQLSRSSTQQQRCTAITTLGNIMDKSKKGLYDKVLEPAPLVALNSKNIFYLLRITIDDSSIAVVTAGLQALRSFLYNQADEICLDKLFGWKYDDGLFNVPELLPPKNDVDNYDELKDDEFVQLDVVGAAIRSDLILRIRFILSELKPPLVGVTAALEILTRLSRHSRKTALNIACTKNLLEIIVKNFIPLTNNNDDGKNAYGVPQLNAVRFCRVLLEYAGRPVADRLYNLKIINCLLSYTTCGSSVVGRGDLQLSIEALRLWKLILNYGIGKDSIVGARLMLGTQLQLLLSNHIIHYYTVNKMDNST